MATNRVSTLSAEVLNSGATANARVSTLSAEVLNSGASAVNARVSTLFVEVLSLAAQPITGTFNATEGTDTFQGISALVANWQSTEAADTFAGTVTTPVSGALASTEAHDAFVSFVFTPPSAVMASTEAPDTWGNYPGIELLGLDTFDHPSDANHPTIFTTGFDRIIILAISDAAVVQGRPKLITGITDQAGLVWKQRAVIATGPEQDDAFANLQVWWAYSHLPLVANQLTITYDNGEGGSVTTAQATHWFAVKGLNGNFAYPFADVDNFGSKESGIGSWASKHGTPQSIPANFLPLVTGHTIGSGALAEFMPNGSYPPAGGFVTPLTISQNITVSSGDLGASNASSDDAVAGTLAPNFIGEFHFEATFDHIGGTNYGVGLIPLYSPHITDGTIAGYADSGTGLYGILVRGDGNIYVNDTLVGTLGDTPANGDVISIDVVIPLHLFWARNITQSGKYNGVATANPATLTGGFGFTLGGDANPAGGQSADGTFVEFMPQPLLRDILTPVLALGGAGSHISANFGQLPFDGVVPFGFTEGWPTGGASDSDPTEVYPTFVYSFTDAHAGGTPSLTGSSGYTPIMNTEIGGSQRNLVMLSQYKLLHFAQSAAANDVVQGGSLSPAWQQFSDALKPGQNAPGEFVTIDQQDGFRTLGYVGAFGIVGEVVAHEAPDIFHAVGFEAASGIFVTTDSPDTFSAFGFQPMTGVWNSTEAPDKFAGTGIGRGEDGVWASTEAVDICQIIGNTPASGSFVTTETTDQFRAFGAGVIRNTRRRLVFVG